MLLLAVFRRVMPMVSMQACPIWANLLVHTVITILWPSTLATQMVTMRLLLIGIMIKVITVTMVAMLGRCQFANTPEVAEMQDLGITRLRLPPAGSFRFQWRPRESQSQSHVYVLNMSTPSMMLKGTFFRSMIVMRMLTWMVSLYQRMREA